MVAIFTHAYKIHSYESDFEGHAQITAFLNYMQESAWNHAEQLGVGYSYLLQKNLAWVLGRLRLQVFAWPHWGETITLHTWPSGADRLYCFRDFKFLDPAGATIAVASTSWLVVDLDKHRPQRTETYINLPTDGAERVFTEFAPKVAALEAGKNNSSVSVKTSHLDVNGHVNNVKYVEFVLDSFPIEFRKQHRLLDLKINFMNEALYGDEILIRTAEDGSGGFLHSLVRPSDGVELGRVLTYWE